RLPKMLTCGVRVALMVFLLSFGVSPMTEGPEPEGEKAELQGGAKHAPPGVALRLGRPRVQRAGRMGVTANEGERQGAPIRTPWTSVFQVRYRRLPRCAGWCPAL